MAANIRKSERVGMVAGEDRTYTVELGTFPEIIAGAALDSVTPSVSPSGPTVAATVSDSDTALLRISGTSALGGNTYQVKLLCTLDDSAPSDVACYFDLQIEPMN